VRDRGGLIGIHLEALSVSLLSISPSGCLDTASLGEATAPGDRQAHLRTLDTLSSPMVSMTRATRSKQARRSNRCLVTRLWAIGVVVVAVVEAIRQAAVALVFGFVRGTTLRSSFNE
jgi:hypothetical protein